MFGVQYGWLGDREREAQSTCPKIDCIRKRGVSGKSLFRLVFLARKGSGTRSEAERAAASDDVDLRPSNAEEGNSKRQSPNSPICYYPSASPQLPTHSSTYPSRPKSACLEAVSSVLRWAPSSNPALPFHRAETAICNKARVAFPPASITKTATRIPLDKQNSILHFIVVGDSFSSQNDARRGVQEQEFQ